jgi:hypothetical protein
MAINTYNIPAELSLTGNLSENWRKFPQAFEIYLEAGGLTTVPEARKIAILLNVIGEEGLAVYNTFEFTDNKKTLAHILEKFKDYCNPKQNVLHCRFKFFNRHQRADEQFDHFLTDVKILSNDCQFCVNCKESMIRDRLVFGTSNCESQEKLIKKGEPSLEEVVSILRLADISHNQLKDIKKNEVNAVKQSTYKYGAQKKSVQNVGINIDMPSVRLTIKHVPNVVLKITLLRCVRIQQKM